MMKDALSDRSLPADFPARIGRIVRAEGPLIEARFEPAGPPELFSTLIADDEAGRAGRAGPASRHVGALPVHVRSRRARGRSPEHPRRGLYARHRRDPDGLP